MKNKDVIYKKIFLVRIGPGPVSSQESTLPTAPLQRTMRMLHEERLTPDLNSEGTAHVITYWRESLFKTLFPSSVALSIFFEG